MFAQLLYRLPFHSNFSAGGLLGNKNIYIYIYVDLCVTCKPVGFLNDQVCVCVWHFAAHKHSFYSLYCSSETEDCLNTVKSDSQIRGRGENLIKETSPQNLGFPKVGPKLCRGDQVWLMGFLKAQGKSNFWVLKSTLEVFLWLKGIVVHQKLKNCHNLLSFMLFQIFLMWNTKKVNLKKKCIACFFSSYNESQNSIGPD